MVNSYKPQGVPDLIPYLTVQNAEQSIKFYKEAFGFEVIQLGHGEGNEITHVEMRKAEVIIMFCPEGAFGNINKAPITQNIIMPLSMYIYCVDVDKLYQQAIKVGAISKMIPSIGFWGDRFCTLLDIDGYEWSFATYLGDDGNIATKH
jgi:PhnB protein